MPEKEKVFFIRRNQNDDGFVPMDGRVSPTMSPDIICYQNATLDYTDAVASYPKYICKHFRQDTVNNIYVRAINNTGTAQNGEVKAYYSPLTMLYIPEHWTPLRLGSGETVVELRQNLHEYAEPGAIVVSKEAFLLENVENPKLHHCMLAVSRCKGEEWLPLPPSFNGDKGLWNFLREHANIAYNNIVIETGFHNQHTEVVLIGNHNDYYESYAVQFTLVSKDGNQKDTFGNCNIGRIQMLSTNIDSHFDYDIYPEAGASTAVSPTFQLPAKYAKHIIITYFAADQSKDVFGTIVHDYITCNSQGHIPVRNAVHQMLRTTNPAGNDILINTDAKLGDYTIIFTNDAEDNLQTLKQYDNETDRSF